jgi:C-terminal processing protease CtpA/Prc
MFGQGGMLMEGLEKDEVTASVGDDYDYARQYRRQQQLNHAQADRSRMTSEDFTKSSSLGSTGMSRTGRVGESLFADDASFEQQFSEAEERYDVVAPPGKLGMVIDTPNGGMPVVHAIKDTSALADRVRVGDRLLSVDDEDCTGMTAMQVSKLISLKSSKPRRVLVFARSRTGTRDP